MKRWRVEYNGEGVVTRITPGSDALVGLEPWHVEVLGGDNRLYCDAIDELGALARFMEVWEKHNA
jgi:hypothetical protein